MRRSRSHALNAYDVHDMNQDDPIDVAAEVRAFLERERTASLATVDDARVPYAANVQYALTPDALQLLFVSSPKSQHSLNIATQPKVALAVYGPSNGPAEIHGVQLRGTCEPVVSDSHAWQAAWDAYVAAFPFVAETPAFRERVASESFYAVTLTWARYIDNRRGFGWKIERDL